MNKLSYDIIAIHADELTTAMALSKNFYEAVVAVINYVEYLKACGWTVQEFDNETIKRVDANWGPVKEVWN